MQALIQANRQTGRPKSTQTGGQSNKQACMQENRQIDNYTDGQADLVVSHDRHAGRQSNRQTDFQV